MKCPFHKNISYFAPETVLEGCFPTDWKVIETFEDCIGEECAAFALEYRYDSDAIDSKPMPKCLLCQSK